MSHAGGDKHAKRAVNDDFSTSLPENLDETENMLGANFNSNTEATNKKKQDAKSSDMLEQDPMPVSTPPPPSKSSSRASPVLDDEIRLDLQRDEHLVYIKIMNVDQSHPDFATKHNSTHRFVDVDFNTLDIMFNLKSWVMIFDFFGIGSPQSVPADATTAKKEKNFPRNNYVKSVKPTAADAPKGPHVNMEIDVKVKALSVTLNHEAYEVAVATVKTFISRMSFRDGNFAIGGTLGNFLVKDLTPQGFLYRDR